MDKNWELVKETFDREGVDKIIDLTIWGVGYYGKVSESE
jgi:hypothetical protein